MPDPTWAISTRPTRSVWLCSLGCALSPLFGGQTERIAVFSIARWGCCNRQTANVNRIGDLMAFGKKSWLSGVTAVVALALAIGTVATPANAAPSQSVSASSSSPNGAGAQASYFSASISGTAGNVTFDAAKARALGGDAKTIEQFAEGIVAGGGRVTGITVDVRNVSRLSQSLVAAKSSCAGQNNGSTQWFGLQLKIDSCKANTLIAMMAGGAATATIAGVLTSWTGIGGISAGLIAGLLGLGSAIVAGCAARGTGLILDLAWTGLPWCAAQ